MVNDKKRLLIIDDDPEVVELIELLLGDAFTVASSIDPDAAIRLLSAETFEVVLTDLNMPGISGKQLIAKVRKMGIQVPIIVITGFGENDPEVVEAIKSGGNGVLTKPFRNLAEIPEKIRKMINI